MQFLATPTADGKRTDVYLAELLVLNGGQLQVTAVNDFKKADNKFGRLGLSINEALHLVGMLGYLRGLINGTGVDEMDVLEYIRNETERVVRNSPIYIPTHAEERKFS